MRGRRLWTTALAFSAGLLLGGLTLVTLTGRWDRAAAWLPAEPEWARWALDYVADYDLVRSGTPEVVLNRRADAAELPCLLDWPRARFPDHPLALVILRGDLDRPSFPGGGWINGGYEYLAFVFDLTDPPT